MQNGLAPVDPGRDHQDGHRIEGARVVRQAPADEHEAAGFARARVASDESTPVRADDRLEFARIVETPTPQGRRAAVFDAMRSVGEIGWLAAKPRISDAVRRELRGEFAARAFHRRRPAGAKFTEQAAYASTKKMPRRTISRGLFVAMIGAPGRIRTHDPLVRSQVLYPTELRAQIKP